MPAAVFALTFCSLIALLCPPPAPAGESAAQENNRSSEGLDQNQLGLIYEKQGKYLEAENAFDRSISLLTRAEGETASDLIPPMRNLANLLYESGQYSRAENLIAREVALHKYGLAKEAAESSLKTITDGGGAEGLGPL